MMSVSSTTSSSDGTSPMVPTARDHQVPSTIQERIPPVMAMAGMRVAALSMKSAAFRIDSRTAKPQIEEDAPGCQARNNNRPSPVSNTMPAPCGGFSGFWNRRASTGTSSANTP